MSDLWTNRRLCVAPEMISAMAAMIKNWRSSKLGLPGTFWLRLQIDILAEADVKYITPFNGATSHQLAKDLTNCPRRQLSKTINC
jgi:hypothetical protein